jgi:hypothetical protein
LGVINCYRCTLNAKGRRSDASQMGEIIARHGDSDVRL